MAIIASDNFDTDTTGVAPVDWNVVSGTYMVGTVNPVSGAKTFGDSSNTNGTVAIYTGAGVLGDHTYTATQKLPIANDSASYYLAFFADSGFTTGYLFGLEGTGSGTLQYTCYKRNGGYSVLGSPAAATGFSAGDFVYMEVKTTGTTLEFRVWKVGDPRPSTASLSRIDSSFTSGYPGLYRANITSLALAIDDFLVEDSSVATVPGAPTIGTATAGNTTATFAFTAPGSNGGSPINGYTVTTSTGQTGTGASSPITITGMTNGVAATGTVHATNAVGDSAESAASNSVTPTAVNAAPTFPGSISNIAGTAGAAITPVDVHAAFSDTDALAYSASPAGTAWPSGLVVNSTTGIISGTVAAAGTTTGIKVRATDTTSQTVDSNAFNAVIGASSTFAVTDSSVFFSPYNCYSDGAGAMQSNNVRASSTYAWSNMRGSYLKFKATVGASGTIGLTIDTSTLSAIAAAGCPQIEWNISGAPTQSHMLVTGETSLSLATGLSAGTYDVVVGFRGVYITQDGDVAQNYTASNNKFHITAINLSTGGTLSAPPMKSKRMLVLGDSITDGDLSNGGPRSATSQNTFMTYGWVLAEALDAEVGIVGFYGQQWSWLDSSWPNYASGKSRLIAGLLSPAPDYIIINYGENNGDPGPASATVTATLAAISAAAPSAKIILLIPFSGRARTNLTAATLPANGYRIDLAPYQMLNGRTEWSYDGQHPNQRGHANLGALLAYQVSQLSAPALATRTVSITLDSAASTPAASLAGLKVSFWDESSPELTTDARYQSAVETTDGSGVLTFTFGSTLSPGGTGWIDVRGTGLHYCGQVVVS